jgi:putative sigma-54 modulation protein
MSALLLAGNQSFRATRADKNVRAPPLGDTKGAPGEAAGFYGWPVHHWLMNLILSTQNVTLTKAIEDHIMSRIQKLEKMDRYALSARVILEHDKTRAPERQFTCSVRLDVPGPDLFAGDVESDLYAAIDLVFKKIEQQVRKRHNKYKARKHKVASRSKHKLKEGGL